MSALLEFEAAFVRPPSRTLTPPKLRCLPQVADENATVVETFRIHYAGLLGSPGFVRVVDVGARVLVDDVDVAAGLCRVRLDAWDESTALVVLDHVRLDDDVRGEGYLCPQ